MSRAVTRTGTGRWLEAVMDVPAAAFTGALAGADITLTVSERCAVHMVEVQGGE